VGVGVGVSMLEHDGIEINTNVESDTGHLSRRLVTVTHIAMS
jgi:hypothetical protein